MRYFGVTIVLLLIFLNLVISIDPSSQDIKHLAKKMLNEREKQERIQLKQKDADHYEEIKNSKIPYLLTCYKLIKYESNDDPIIDYAKQLCMENAIEQMKRINIKDVL